MILKNNDQFCEYIFETRYSANPLILDYRGNLANVFSKTMNLPHWRVDTNRVDNFDNLDIDMERVFVSYQNFGTVIKCNYKIAPKPHNYYFEKTIKFINCLFELEYHPQNSDIKRIGTRIKLIIPSTEKFENLLDFYMNRFITLTVDAKKAIGADPIDIGSPMDFKTKHGNLHLIVGPIKDSQILTYFPYINKIIDYKLPNVGLYLDFDYWKNIEESVTSNEISNICKLYTEEIFQISERIREIFNEVKK